MFPETGGGAAVRAARAEPARREAAVGEPIFEENWGYRRPCTAAPPPVILGLAETIPTPAIMGDLTPLTL